MRALWVLAALALVAGANAGADESPVYESLATASIGRVFLSQEQRDLLDRLRLRDPEAAQPAGGETEVKEQRPAAAGFIIGPDGRSRTWDEGDFVDSTRSRALSTRFPGDIDVERKAEQLAAEDDETSE